MRLFSTTPFLQFQYTYILSKPDEVARIRESEAEMKEGRGRPLSELENEFKKRKEM